MNQICKFSRIETLIGPVQYADLFYDAVKREESRTYPVPSIQRLQRRFSEAVKGNRHRAA